MNELEIMRAFMAEVPVAMPHVRVFRREIVNADVQRNGRSYHIKAGIKGQSDLYAYAFGGRVIEIETKAAKGALAEEQKAWRAFCEEWRIPHLVLRAKAGEHSATTIERWIGELRACLT
jgi:hypothetical protein